MADPTDDDTLHPAVRRILRETDNPELVDLLARLAASDLTSLLLEVAQRRAAARSPSDVLRQYERDRFTRPTQVDAPVLRTLAARAAAVVEQEYELLELSPLVPLGTHSAIAGVSQHRVVTTIRATEVAADPANSLALEAAARRRMMLRANPRSATPVRLATIDRVVRAQRFRQPRSFAHFVLLGLATAGRDRGNQRFEAETLCEQLDTLMASCRAGGFRQTVIHLTDLTGANDDVLGEVRDVVSSPDVSVVADPERSTGRNYYTSACFKLAVVENGEAIEVADGGFVDWTQVLLANRKERLLVSGLSLERLATLRTSGQRT